MGNEIIIDKKKIRIVEWESERVIITKDIAALHGLDVRVINQKYRRNKKYFVKGEDYFEVRKEDLTNHKSVTSQEIKASLFRNPAEYILLITESGYLNFVKTINDDISWKIFKQLKSIYFRVQNEQFKDAREKSKEVRNGFTGMLQDRGYNKPHHFIQTTKQMRKEMGIENKKDQMTQEELIDISMAELLSMRKVGNSKATGYYEVNPICKESSKQITQLVNAPTLEQLEQESTLYSDAKGSSNTQSKEVRNE